MRRVPLLLFLLLGASLAAATHWGGHEEIDNGNGNASGVDVATAEDGTSIAVWRQNPGNIKVYANLYIPGQGWQGAHRINEGTDYACFPRIAMTPGGTAIVTWGEGGTCGAQQPGRDAYAVTYTPGQPWPQGWGTPTLLESNSEPVTQHVHVNVGSGGHAVAAWAHEEANGQSIWAAHYAPGSGWATAKELADGSADRYISDVDVNKGGSALVAWTRSQTINDETIEHVEAARYNGGWGAATRVDGTDEADARVRAGLGDDGRGFVIWDERTNIGGSVVSIVHAARLDGTWQAPVRINSGSQSASVGDFGIGADGSAVAVWAQASGDSQLIYAARYAGGWGTPVAIDSGAGVATATAASVDTYGNAVAVWGRDQSALFSARYVPGTGWSAAEELATLGVSSIITPRVSAFGENGAVVWIYFDSLTYGTDAHANAFSLEDPAPTLTITKPGAYTKTKQVVVSGTATIGSHLTIQGESVAVNPSTGAFQVTFQRSDGEHSFTVAAKTGGGTTTKTVTTTVDTAPPTIDVTSPTPGATVEQSSLTIQASTDPKAVATIDGRTVSVSQTGEISHAVTLKQGLNSFLLSATDPAGHITKYTLNVTYQPPGTAPPADDPDTNPDPDPAGDDPAGDAPADPDPGAGTDPSPPADGGDATDGADGSDPDGTQTDPDGGASNDGNDADTHGDTDPPSPDKDSPGAAFVLVAALIVAAAFVRRRR